MNLTTVIYLLLISFAGSFGTYKLSQKLDNILGSTLITLVGSAIIIVISKINYFHYDQFLYCLYGASFVGMCDSKIFNKINMLIATFAYFVFFILVTPRLGGLGGSLGFTAFLATINTSFLKLK